MEPSSGMEPIPDGILDPSPVAGSWDEIPATPAGVPRLAPVLTEYAPGTPATPEPRGFGSPLSPKFIINWAES